MDEGDADDLRSLGDATRRRVLGDEYVDRAWSDNDPVMQEVQDFITRHCWGEVWSRPALDLRTRRLITCAMLAAQRSWPELRTHVSAALQSGCTSAEIAETFLHSGLYAGAPAMVGAFQAVRDLLSDASAQHER